MSSLCTHGAASIPAACDICPGSAPDRTLGDTRLSRPAFPGARPAKRNAPQATARAAPPGTPQLRRTARAAAPVQRQPDNTGQPATDDAVGARLI